MSVSSTPASAIRCYITDRHTLPSGGSLLDAVAQNLLNGVDWIQIREKDLGARDLFALVQQVLALPNAATCRIIVNSRMDVALAAGAAGCHLPANSPAPSLWKNITPAGFEIGVSCHTVEEVRAAESEGATYAVFGPVFAPRSKISPLPPTGITELHRAAQSVRIPVLALGGITAQNAKQCVDAGAAGIAGISLFQASFQTLFQKRVD